MVWAVHVEPGVEELDEELLEELVLEAELLDDELDDDDDPPDDPGELAQPDKTANKIPPDIIIITIRRVKLFLIKCLLSNNIFREYCICL